ncbi:MAG TPA: META domain-containing protein [Gemmatimonadales bacterium]|nr:META domain-containing protein [Gemmatimonadales bacterium]
MARTLMIATVLLAVAACSPRDPEGRKVVAAESTVPLADSLPSAEKATPLLEQGAPTVDPALATGDQLAGTSWQWLSTQTPVETVTAPEPKNYVITFGTDGRITGKADCNRMMGTYQATAKELTFGGLGTTRMACPPGSLGERFARDLGFVRNYTFYTPDTLRMDMMADGGTFTFLRTR